MKKIFFNILAFAFIVFSVSGWKKAVTPEDDKIYFFFSNTCPHCHDALDYINRKYPDLNVTLVNVADDDGYDMFAASAKKFKLGSEVGTPLFCMGDNYIMGWSPEIEQKFDEYVRPYL